MGNFNTAVLNVIEVFPQMNPVELQMCADDGN